MRDIGWLQRDNTVMFKKKPIYDGLFCFSPACLLFLLLLK